MTKKVVFIGAGNMGGSLIGGLLANGFAAGDIGFVEKRSERIAAVTAQFGIEPVAKLDELAASEAVVLAVKPQIMTEVLHELGQALARCDKQPLWISVAAGFSCQQIAHDLGLIPCAIVRCMPNTPSMVQAGASGLFANEQVSAAQCELAEQLLSAVGYAAWVADEDLLHAVTAAAGSASAYFFYLMNAMVEEAIALGLEPLQARMFVTQTCLGAAKMAQASDQPLSQLQKNVMSPGGVTEAAIHYMQSVQADDMIKNTMQAANARSIAMANNE